MKRAILVLLAACGGGDATGQPDGSVSGDAGGDASSGCGVSVTFEPPMPYAFPGSRTRAVVHVTNAAGVLAYTWQIRKGTQSVTFTPAAPDMSAVDFDTAVADSYEAFVQVTGSTQPCPSTPFNVNVLVPNANAKQIRMRVYPPSTIAAPPNEKLVLVHGGANMSVGVVTVDPGVMVSGNSTAQAYLRFIPLAARDAYVEAFSDTSGAFSVRVLNQPHDVLVVPLVAGFAPKLHTSWLPGANLPLDGGTLITGEVRDHANALVAGAQVQLVIAGVPTSLATAVDGTFAVRASTLSGPATIEVTAPAASGLPRLVASSSAWSFAQALVVKYDAGIVIRDLGGTVVRRGSVAQGGAAVSIVGTFANAGQVATGTTTAMASGEVRATAITAGNGALPTLRVPDELLAAVVSPSAGDVTMSTLDLRTSVPPAIDAPPMTPSSVQLRNGTSSPLPGAILDVEPTGLLAMSGRGAQRLVANASGTVTAQLAPGATYNFHYVDPQGHDVNRLAGPKTETGSSLPSVYILPKALEVKGNLALAGNPQAIGNAAVQILCAVDCSGIARRLPLAAGASTSQGAFAVAVADPGTMPP